ncbi:alpha/beta fold hydrolase [Pseudonocardia sp. CA-107938]|uniref:alpha/beta fold hydrolase n=1 Tax=Pseudonocardia sp. CA-107938 TaxID=3240021 RepID=UPI003D93C72F
MEQFVTARDEARLCVEAFGDAADPAVLLIGGAASPMDYWEDGFCALIAAGGRYVIRYDAHDTGRSTTWPVGEPGYTFAELRDDPIAVLDGLGIARAHVVGISMGASIATTLATRHRDRVLTLTLATSSPGGPDLPPPSSAIQASFAEPAPPVDPSDRAALVAKMVADLRLFAGTLPFDEERLRALVERVVDRSDSPASADNHWILVGGDDGEEPIDLGSITAPTLVWHGTADPLFPLPHGRAFAERIPNARLVVLDGVGHEYPPPSTWDRVVTELLAHTAQVTPALP